MRSYLIIPMLELFQRGKIISLSFIEMEKFLHFSITLRMLYPAEYLLDALLIKKFLECTFSTSITRKLRAMITDALLNLAVFQRRFHAGNA